MSDFNATEIQAGALTELAEGHDAFTTVDEIGADAAGEAPATSTLCIGIIVGATYGAGC